MKKLLLFLLMGSSILLLSACSQNPFNPVPGTEFRESDTLSFDYYNGIETETLFEYTFSHEYFFFESEAAGNYSFTSINNYLEISNEFILFLEFYNQYIEYDRFLNENYGDYLKLSLGATEGKFNLIEVPVDSDIYDIDAFIVIENGLRVIFSYTEFYSDGELIIVPFYVSVLAYDIHELYLKEYLPINNEYVEEKAILTTYKTRIIPLPPKVETWPSSFDEKDNDLLDLGHFMRIVLDFSNTDSHTESECTDLITENCFESEFSVLSGFIYNYSIIEIVTFYELNYGGRYDGDVFIFFKDNIAYKISLAETTITIDYDFKDSSTEDVITYEITKYND